jgi:hypothetical protein
MRRADLGRLRPASVLWGQKGWAHPIKAAHSVTGWLRRRSPRLRPRAVRRRGFAGQLDGGPRVLPRVLRRMRIAHRLAVFQQAGVFARSAPRFMPAIARAAAHTQVHSSIALLRDQFERTLRFRERVVSTEHERALATVLARDGRPGRDGPAREPAGRPAINVIRHLRFEQPGIAAVPSTTSRAAPWVPATEQPLRVSAVPTPSIRERPTGPRQDSGATAMPHGHPMIAPPPPAQRQVPVDTEEITTQVLRRIERRAIAQRERLGLV